MKDFRSNEVLLWRVAGAATWQAVFVTVLYGCLQAICNPWLVASPARAVSSTFGVGNLITLATLFFALVPSTVAHAAVISTHQPALKQPVFVRFLPTSFAKALARRVTAQTSSLQSAVSLPAFLFAHATSALVFFLRYLPRKANGLGKPSCVGPILFPSHLFTADAFCPSCRSRSHDMAGFYSRACISRPCAVLFTHNVDVPFCAIPSLSPNEAQGSSRCDCACRWHRHRGGRSRSDTLSAGRKRKSPSTIVIRGRAVCFLLLRAVLVNRCCGLGGRPH